MECAANDCYYESSGSSFAAKPEALVEINRKGDMGSIVIKVLILFFLPLSLLAKTSSKLNTTDPNERIGLKAYEKGGSAIRIAIQPIKDVYDPETKYSQVDEFETPFTRKDAPSKKTGKGSGKEKSSQ